MRTVFSQWSARLRFWKRQPRTQRVEMGATIVITNAGRSVAVVKMANMSERLNGHTVVTFVSLDRSMKRVALRPDVRSDEIRDTKERGWT